MGITWITSDNFVWKEFNSSNVFQVIHSFCKLWIFRAIQTANMKRETDGKLSHTGVLSSNINRVKMCIREYIKWNARKATPPFACKIHVPSLSATHESFFRKILYGQLSALLSKMQLTVLYRLISIAHVEFHSEVVYFTSPHITAWKKDCDPKFDFTSMQLRTGQTKG